MTLSSTAADIWLAHWIIDQKDPDWTAASHDTSALPLPETPAPVYVTTLWLRWGSDQWRQDRFIYSESQWLTRTHARTHGVHVSSKTFITRLCASWLCNELSDKKNSHADIHPPSEWMREEIEDLEIVSPRRHRWSAEELQSDLIRNRSQLQTCF